MRAALAVFSAVILPGALMAQAPAVGPGPEGYVVLDPGLTGGRFLIAVLSGVFLAYCFQWLLTNLSVAVGISALRGVTDSGKREKARRKEEENAARHPDDLSGSRQREEKDGWGDKAVKIGSGIGIWAAITSSIALFLAAWLAVELIPVQSNRQGVILGLVIWSIFLGTMMYLESAAAGSLLGLISGTVRNGVGAMLSPFKAAAGKLSESRAQTAQRERTVQTAEEVAAAVRREMYPSEGSGDWEIEGPGITDRIRGYVQSNLKPKALDMAHVGREIKDLLTDPELVDMAKRGELRNLDRSHFAEIVSARTDLDRDQVERMVDTVHSAWAKFMGENAPAAEGMPSGSSEWLPAGATGGQGQGIRARYQGFREYLRSTGREELRPERLEQEIKTLVLDPKAGLSQLKEHARELDRESLIQVLAQRQDMTPEEAARIADQIDLARSKALSAKEQAEHRAQEVRDRALAKIRDRLYALNRPELDYEGFKGDFKKLLDDPKAGYSALKSRLQGLDRESLIAILGSQEGVSREDAEKMVDKGEAIKAKVEQVAGQAKAGAEKAATQAKAGYAKVADSILEAKEAVLERARKVEEETKRRIEEAKRLAMEQAEATRKVTAAAAWWMLAIAIISGAAAALGGLTAAGT